MRARVGIRAGIAVSPASDATKCARMALDRTVPRIKVHLEARTY